MSHVRGGVHALHQHALRLRLPSLWQAAGRCEGGSGGSDDKSILSADPQHKVLWTQGAACAPQATTGSIHPTCLLQLPCLCTM